MNLRKKGAESESLSGFVLTQGARGRVRQRRQSDSDAQDGDVNATLSHWVQLIGSSITRRCHLVVFCDVMFRRGGKNASVQNHQYSTQKFKSQRVLRLKQLDLECKPLGNSDDRARAWAT